MAAREPLWIAGNTLLRDVSGDTVSQPTGSHSWLRLPSTEYVLMSCSGIRVRSISFNPHKPFQVLGIVPLYKSGKSDLERVIYSKPNIGSRGIKPEPRFICLFLHQRKKEAWSQPARRARYEKEWLKCRIQHRLAGPIKACIVQKQRQI